MRCAGRWDIPIYHEGTTEQQSTPSPDQNGDDLEKYQLPDDASLADVQAFIDRMGLRVWRRLLIFHLSVVLGSRREEEKRELDLH